MFIVRVVYIVSVLFIIVGNFRKIFFSKDLSKFLPPPLSKSFQTFLGFVFSELENSRLPVWVYVRSSFPPWGLNSLSPLDGAIPFFFSCNCGSFNLTWYVIEWNWHQIYCKFFFLLFFPHKVKPEKVFLHMFNLSLPEEER